MLDAFPLGQQIIGEAAQKEFIQLFGQILRLENILTSFDDFTRNEILTARQGRITAASTSTCTPSSARTRTPTRRASTTTSSSRSS
ncbi:type I restriction endonuclease subunit R, EcoR124 family [Tessaracoccus coleopterorum]|uniref:type I restriction endonuclease subunit R, EcoR124 family n=1 Tax=Tessaracoccus coleopterorum TaxID=2714950 RepID=UPI0022B2212F|nr:hypothetical protein [Tessaracoccus coleopterorum]